MADRNGVVDVTPALDGEARKLAELLRSAAAWLRLGADWLGAGDTENAAGAVALGLFGVEGVDDAVSALGRRPVSDTRSGHQDG